MKRGPSGYLLPISTLGETCRAFVPKPLPPDPPLVLDDRLQILAQQAATALGRLDGISSLLPEPHLFLYSYIRKEAVLSSQIEGTRSSLSDLLLFEVEGISGAPLDDVRAVSNYVAALERGVTLLKEGLPISLRLIREIHGVLLRDGRGADKEPGQFGRRFQINFRNHRKLVLTDSRTAFVGGLNVGDEYMGLCRRFGPWRDTHLRIEGPAVAGFQLPFLEDWNYVTRTVPPFRLPTPSTSHGGNAVVFPIASGPAQSWSPCPAVYLTAINAATKRLWLASPYFVPSSPLFQAVCHAALRGVDVRIILPQLADHTLPWLSSFTFYPKLLEAGVKVWRYQQGFMHQKVLLADSETAIVGSINLDYRSFMLNFELSAAVQDAAFASSVETKFLADFDRSRPEDLGLFDKAPLLFRLKCRAAALMSPEQ